MFARITWYAKRLAVMEPAELLHRLKEQFLLASLYVRYHLRILPGGNYTPSRLDYQFSRSMTAELPDLEWDITALDSDSETILSGRSDALGYKWTWSENKGIWHKAPDTGKHWPRRFFSSINYRENNCCGDIRIAWEPSRLQQLVSLALLANSIDASTHERAVSLIERQLDSWIEDNPPLCGIHYISSMECALRILAICHALDLVRSQLINPDVIWGKALCLIRDHAAFILKRMSLHSSSGNHTVAECAGLIYAGILFPEFDEASVWKETGIAILGKEVDRQILEDGGGIERSVWYHLFVMDLCGLALSLLEHKGIEGVENIRAAFVRGCTFLNVLANRPDQLPTIGDADNGFALSRYLRLSWSITPDQDILQVFESTGISVIRNPEGTEVLYFNHGSLGMPPCYGHGHAHALSVVLRHNDSYLLVDPGTYTYTGQSAWRTYFRSTKAHNTICVDGEDQAKQRASFMWSDAYNCELLHKGFSPDLVTLLACHDGYKRSKDVMHWRGIVYQPGKGWLIWDYVSGKVKLNLEVNWHTRDLARVNDDGFRLSRDVVLLMDGGRSDITSGGSAGSSGWLSDVYGAKYPGKTITCYYGGDLPHEFTTRLIIGGCKLDDVKMAETIREFKKIINETEAN